MVATIESFIKVRLCVVKNGKVLLVRNHGDKHFQIPGGKIEPNEHDIDALTHEVEEELTVTLVLKVQCIWQLLMPKLLAIRMCCRAPIVQRNVRGRSKGRQRNRRTGLAIPSDTVCAMFRCCASAYTASSNALPLRTRIHLMTTIRNIAVYCGSNTGRGSAYLQAATALGTTLAERKIRLIYGGTHKGLMGALADAVLAGGGHVTGVITERLEERGHTHQNLDSVEIFPTMQARKKRMIALADGFIAMPGGIGTLEEFMEVWTLNQLGEIIKPAGLFDVEGYYRPLMGMVDHMIAEKFLPASHRKAIVVQSTSNALIDDLVNFVPVKTQKWMS